ncbi:heme peroxidase [Cladochytrium replicatum]|nr:heme peroxidase [Cladochytrium replicatum]
MLRYWITYVCIVVLVWGAYKLAADTSHDRHIVVDQVSGTSEDQLDFVKRGQIELMGIMPGEVQAIDGKKNNLQHPDLGSSYSPYQRNTPLVYVAPYGNATQSPLPNARLVSSRVLGVPSVQFGVLNPNGVSDLLPTWGIYLHLDVTILDRNDSDPIPIPVPNNDPVFDAFRRLNVPIAATRSVYSGVDTSGARIHPNSFTHWIDGSGLYGPTEERHKILRAYQGGLMKSQLVEGVGELPISKGGKRYWFGHEAINIVPQLSVLYTLLLREHNRRARYLAALNPQWIDDQIFHRARRWVIAIIQKITMLWYYPLIVGEPAPPYSGYNSSVDPSVSLFFSNVALRYGHSATNTLVLRYDEDWQPIPEGHLILRDTIFNPEDYLVVGLEPYFRGFLSQLDQNIDGYVVDDLRSYLPLNDDGKAPYDLISIGIERGRELGLPDYNTCRGVYGLPKVKNWSDITPDVDLQNRMKEVYGSIDTVDAYVGAFAEHHNGTHNAGPLIRAALKDQFLRLRAADRWWYQNPGVLTDSEALDLTDISLGTLIKLNTNITAFPDNTFLVPAFTPSSDISSTPSSKNTDGLPDELNGIAGVSDAYVWSTVQVGMIKMSWMVIQGSGKVWIAMMSNSTGWFGIGFGPNMRDANIYLCTDNYSGGNGNYTIVEARSTVNDIPKPVEQQGIKSNIENLTPLTSVSSKLAFRFSRNLGVSTDSGISIASGQVPMLFAWSLNPVLAYHGMNRTQLKLNILSPTSSNSAVIVTTAAGGLSQLKSLHGTLMSLSFAFVYPMGIFVARYYQGLGKWLDIHIALMSTITSNVIISFLTALVSGFGTQNTFHNYMGMITAGVVCVTTVSGYAISMWITKVIPKRGLNYVRYLHKILGYSIYVMGLYNCVLGVQLITELNVPWVRPWLPWVYLGLNLMIAGGLLWYGEKLKRTDKSLLLKGTVGTVKDNLPEFEWEDVHTRVSLGAKWIVINGVIYDVSNFAKSHPGGPKPLWSVIGLDAGKFYNSSAPVGLPRNGTNTLMGHITGRRTIRGKSPNGSTAPESLSRKMRASTIKSIEKSSSAASSNYPTVDRSNSDGSDPRPSASNEGYSGGKSRGDGFDEMIGFFHEHSRLAHFQLGALAMGRLKRPSVVENEGDNVDDGDEESRMQKLLHDEEQPVEIVYSSEGDDGMMGLTIVAPKNELFGPTATLIPMRRGAVRSSPLSASEYRHFSLVNKKKVIKYSVPGKPETYKFVFLFSNPKDILIVRPGEHVYLQFPDLENGNIVTRAYTPIRCVNKGSLELVIKVYPGGRMTQHIEQSRAMRIRGPLVASWSALNQNTPLGLWKIVGMIAGGTGITPMLLMIDYHLKFSPRDPRTGTPMVHLHLLHVVTSEDEAFYVDELERIQGESMGTLTVTIIAKSRGMGPRTGQVLVGELTQDMLDATMPKPTGRLPRNVTGTLGRRGRLSGDDIGAGRASVTSSRDSKTMKRSGGTSIPSDARERRGSLSVLHQRHNSRSPSAPSQAEIQLGIGLHNGSRKMLQNSSGSDVGNPSADNAPPSPEPTPTSLLLPVWKAEGGVKISSHTGEEGAGEADHRPDIVVTHPSMMRPVDRAPDGSLDMYSVNSSELMSNPSNNRVKRQNGESRQDHCVILVCGPSGMNLTVSEMLSNLGYPNDMVQILS